MEFYWTPERQAKLLQLYRLYYNSDEIAEYFGIPVERVESAIAAFCVED